MEKLELLLYKYDFQKRQIPVIQSIADSIEKFIGFKLPEDYLFFLKNYNGDDSFIEKEFVKLWDADQLLQSNIGYEIFEYLPSTLAIGGNGAGEFIAIEKNKNDELKIILSPFIGLDAKDHIVIGDSFTDFLERLDNGKEWFD